MGNVVRASKGTGFTDEPRGRRSVLENNGAEGQGRGHHAEELSERGVGQEPGVDLDAGSVPVVAQAMPSGPIQAGTLATTAVWGPAEDEFTLVSFRSVAGYVMGPLETSARAGSEIS